MKLEDIKKIAVLGSGTMGHGIAQRYAMGGYEVSVYDIAEAALENAKVMVETNLGTFIEEGYISEEDAMAAVKRIHYTTDLEEAVRDAQFIQESVPERPEIKKNIYEKLDEILPMEGVIIASNASTLNPFILVPERRLPMFTTAHWFAPPHIIPLVEVARGEQTTEEVMEIVMGILKKCGKTPVRMEKYVPGYIINRIQVLLNTEVFYLLDNGVCTPEMLDMAVKASLMPRGMVLGLVQRYDFTGLDISANNILNASYVMPETSKRPAILFDHVDKGELGVKTGKGFFDYSDRETKDVLKKRDKMLIKVLKATEDMITQQV